MNPLDFTALVDKLSCLVLSHPVLFCLVFFCLVLSCLVMEKLSCWATWATKNSFLGHFDPFVRVWATFSILYGPHTWCLGHFFRDLTFGPLLGHFWATLLLSGPLWEHFLGHFGPLYLWATFGPLHYFLGHFGPFFGPLLRHLPILWATFGLLLGHFWATCGPLTYFMGHFWATFGLLLGHLWATYLFHGPLLGYFWATCGLLTYFWATLALFLGYFWATC